MQKVVYILGAGFSAPLGIPVVRDFLLKAKDLYFSDRQKYEHFEVAFRAIRALDSVKNYLHADLFDIEEVFSIIEMQRQLGESGPEVSKFIADVIQAYTPDMSTPVGDSGFPRLWGKDIRWHDYAAFCMAIARVAPADHGRGSYTIEFSNTDYSYDVITLNYDRALEIPLDRLSERSQSLSSPLYYRPAASGGAPNARTTILKLHGDALDGTIIPPTWDKSVRGAVKLDWEHAHRALGAANHVRILGYSFPETDTYFRYFLKAALSRTEHLKTIDILTLDPKGITKQRCDAAFTFKFTRFREAATEDYLKRVRTRQDIEIAHAEAMEGIEIAYTSGLVVQR